MSLPSQVFPRGPASGAQWFESVLRGGAGHAGKSCVFFEQSESVSSPGTFLTTGPTFFFTIAIGENIGHFLAPSTSTLSSVHIYTIYPSICLYIYLYLFSYLHIYLSLYLYEVSVYLPMYLSLFQYILYSRGDKKTPAV